MAIITSTLVNGQWVNTKQPVSLAELREILREKRRERRDAGYTIEGQFFSTYSTEDGEWAERGISAMASELPAYPYTPSGGDPMLLTGGPEGQANRAYKCRRWYVNMCFATEGELWNQANQLHSAGLPLDDLLAAIQSDATWPQREFLWEPPSE